jgi:hypothetical protein
MLDPRNGGEIQQHNEKWKVFVLLGKNKHGLTLEKNSEVLYQVCILRLFPKHKKMHDEWTLYGRIQGT